MLEVKGFRGLRFNRALLPDLNCVITPPYDVITPEERRELASCSSYSMAHLILPEDRQGVDRYQAAANDLSAWIEKKIFVQDQKDSIYLLEQRYKGAQGEERVRRGFLAVAKLPEPGERTVLGHERTFSNVVDDRYRLTESTRANLGPVFVIYDDGVIYNNGRKPLDFLLAPPARPPDIEAHTIDDVEQCVWRLDAPEGLREYFENKRLYIADGHHRFHTACMYRDEMRRKEQKSQLQEYDYVLMGFVSLGDPGLSILPTHRLMAAPVDMKIFLHELEPWFEVTRVEGNLDEEVEQQKNCAIGLVTPVGQYLLRLRPLDRKSLLGDERSPAWRDLDVAVLHKGIIDRIMGLGDFDKFAYERDAQKVLAGVQSGKYNLGFISRATTADQIRACAEAGEAMPHKSTYFFPKLPTGAAIHLLY